jgi:hypothetical protein
MLQATSTTTIMSSTKASSNTSGTGPKHQEQHQSFHLQQFIDHHVKHQQFVEHMEIVTSTHQEHEQK